jgi:hypothetical protein
MRLSAFCNVDQPPMNNVLEGAVRALGGLAETHLVQPWRLAEFVGTGAAAPARVPDVAVADAATRSPQAVVCIGGGLFLDAGQRAAFPEGTVFVGVALSDPQALGASLEIAPEFDLFFTQDPGTLPQYRDRGIAVDRLDLAADPKVYAPLPIEKDRDVVFVGKWTSFRDRVVTALSRVCEIRVFTHVAEKRWSVPAAGPLIHPEELRKEFCRSRIALEVVRVEGVDGHLSSSFRRITPRVFMAGACGTPSVVEGFPSLAEYFVPGIEIQVCEDVDGYVAQTTDLLSAPERLMEMASRTRRRVLRDHTWTWRMEGLVRQIWAVHSSQIDRTAP